jgi:hypothetical protein
MLGGIGGKNGKAPVETLRTATAVGMKLGEVDPRAADGMLDQLSAAVIDDRSNNIPFGFPDEGIVNLNRLADGRAEELGKMVQDQWMSAARCARADDLLRDRQIDAHDAILEEPNPAASEQVGDNTGQRRIEKGSRALRIFLTRSGSVWSQNRHMHEFCGSA